MTIPEQSTNALNAFTAKSMSDHANAIRRIHTHNRKLVKQLKKFSFAMVAQRLGGLLTQPENHSATARIEALIHLAALTCRGKATPTTQQLRNWLNNTMFKDPITGMEDPVEDVFVSNMIMWMGNARLFTGKWYGQGYFVQTCLRALRTISMNADRAWFGQAQRHVTALLRLSEALAERAGASRNSLAESEPRKHVRVSAPIINECTARVTFSESDLCAIGLSREDLEPFVFDISVSSEMMEQTLGHTALERRPILYLDDLAIVAIPTAISVAVLRLVLDYASAHGDSGFLAQTIAEIQWYEIMQGCTAWEIESNDALELHISEDMIDHSGMFDEGGYVHLLLACDNLQHTAVDGLHSIHSLKTSFSKRITEIAKTLSDRPDYRGGLTIVVQGGLGRGFKVGIADLPPGWSCLCLSMDDFVLLRSEPEFTALRAWKLLQQEEHLRERGIFISNLSGFLNYYEYRHNEAFELTPGNQAPGVVHLASDLIRSFRHRTRVGVDRHAVKGPKKSAWIEVQREGETTFFREDSGQPIYASVHHAANGELLGCVETKNRTWWVYSTEQPTEKRHRRLIAMVWEMTLNWLNRLAPLLEARSMQLRSGEILYRLTFPDIEELEDEMDWEEQDIARPSMEIRGTNVIIGCSGPYLQSFALARNLGERLMIETLIRGVCAVSKVPTLTATSTDEIVQAVVLSDEARFIHMTPAMTAEEMMHEAVLVPRPRHLSLEDRAWSRFGLAGQSGWISRSASISDTEAQELLNGAVSAVWRRIRSKLRTLDRYSVIERSLLNFEAIRKERREWHLAAAALLATHEDRAEVMQTANQEEWKRGIAGLASRVVAEMAICTSPLQAGTACSGADLDSLVAEVWTLVECASQSDALHHGMASSGPIVLENGWFSFADSFEDLIGPYLDAQGKRLFQEAADDYGQSFATQNFSKTPDREFNAAFIAEFGLDIETFGEFIELLVTESIKRNEVLFQLQKSEVIDRLIEAGASDPKKAYEMLSLKPRKRWDENKPDNAGRRDWYPWRYNRRLSIIRRPLIQLSIADSPRVVVIPTLIDQTLRYLLQAHDGNLPEGIFDSQQMKSWVGHAADRRGHAFNNKVARRLEKLQWNAVTEVSLPFEDGDHELGDVDVLAWKTDCNVVYAIECKSLSFDRTVGEIGERLNQYVPTIEGGQRTQLQKHLDRISYLETSRSQLATLTAIAENEQTLRSALVTEDLVPMQFLGRGRETLDVIIDYASLERHFASA